MATINDLVRRGPLVHASYARCSSPLFRPFCILLTPPLLPLPPLSPRQRLILPNSSQDAAIARLRDLGILRPHARKVAEWLSSAEGGSSLPPIAESAAARRVTLCVEGNISVGKSSFLREVTSKDEKLKGLVQGPPLGRGGKAQCMVTVCLQFLTSSPRPYFPNYFSPSVSPHRAFAAVVPEPVDQWQSVNGKADQNILAAFYKDPKRFAYTFQNYVFATRMKQEQSSRASDKPLRLMERSVFSDRMVGGGVGRARRSRSR